MESASNNDEQAVEPFGVTAGAQQVFEHEEFKPMDNEQAEAKPAQHLVPRGGEVISGMFGLLQMGFVVFFHNSLAQVVHMQITVMLMLLLV
ncbi:MAG: hypothetical protein AAF337_14740, partial [Pseudomonadota bacterium]